LSACVEAWASRAYVWGDADCGRFASACVEAVAGVEIWPSGMAAYSSEAGLARALKRLGCADLADAVTLCLGDPIPALAAHRGDILWDGQAIGVMAFGGPVVFSHDGLVSIDRRSLVAAWAVGRSDG
jgi:hypothetical protein